tara:strand:+ start:937 stop:1692 length:756 start_codon:yes stop_codon:yes gene_type:complete
MSTQALAAVIEHSPYKGAAFAVHMIIADVVNPQNGNKFWMSFNSTAKRARITRRAAINAVKTMLEDGMLILVEKRDNNSSIYQFVLPDSMDFSLEGGEHNSLGGEQISPEVVNTVPVASEPSSPKPNKNPKGTQTNGNEAEVIYSMYPRRVGKGGKNGAIASITKALKSNSFEKLLERTKQYAEMVADKEKQFIPYPSTWFNQERYNDDPDEWMDNEAKQKKINQLKHRLEYETDPATWEQLKQQIKILQQ